MSRLAGQTQKPKKVQPAAQKEGRRPEVAEVEPLFSTYDASKPEGAYFDEAAADRAVEWIESKLRHFKGRWAGSPFYLMAWQRRLVRHIFGWKRADGLRLYRTVYVEAPRKSGKSSLASAIALLLAHGDDEAAPEVACAAYDREQAGIVYSTARFMVEASPELHAASAIYNSRKEMQLRENAGGWIRALSRESAGQYGLNLHGLVFDELFTQKTREMWEALTTSQASRQQPLTFCISTAGWDQASVCFEQHEVVRQISEGAAADPTFLGVVFGAPMDADWTDEEVWKRANPSLGETASLDFYREKAAKAKAVPAEQNAFRTLLLSQWVGQPETFFDMRLWDRCAEVPTGKTGAAFGGLDLSATTDLTAFMVVCEQDSKLDIYLWAFLPAEGIVDREHRDRVPYRSWAEQGFITLTPGRTVDYGAVREAVREANSLFDLRDVSYDRWNSSQLVKELTDEGIVMVQVGQGFAGISAATKELLRQVTDENLRHGGDPLLRWCAANAAAATDPAGNVKPDRARSGARIDPVVALVMAVDGWMRRGREVKRVSVYEKRRAMFAAQDGVAA